MSEAVLKLKSKGQSQRAILPLGELVTIGRSSTCQIQIKDASVSREHCVAIYTDGNVCINDLQSTHGLFRDGVRKNRVELQPGEDCHLGNVHVRFVAATGDDTDASAEDSDDGGAEDDGSYDGGAPGTDTGAGDAASALATSGPAVSTYPAPAIDGYRIIERLGEGGFGVVYRAEQLQLGREVALKVLKKDPDAADETPRIEAFLREARTAARLQDPHLVQVFDVGESNGEYFLSMGLVEGGSLARRIKRDGPMAWGDVLNLIRDVTRALVVAHGVGLVHRDVKPGNILMSRNGSARLTDLGLAIGDAEAGTIAFMAPEQLRREPIDGRADIYALGCTAYAALTGSPPFTGDRQQMARAQVKARPQPFSERNVQVPWHLQQLILDSMMAKDPDDRPQDAASLLDRLDRLILPSGAEAAAQARPYPNVAPKAAPRIQRAGAPPPQRAFLARLAAESIVFSIVAVAVVALLLALRIVFPWMDIYRLVGK